MNDASATTAAIVIDTRDTYLIQRLCKPHVSPSGDWELVEEPVVGLPEEKQP